MIKRLKYVSRHAGPLDQSDLNDIAVKSERNNSAANITGVFMTSGGMFFQVLEGPSEAVDATYARISADPRHKHIVLLGEPEITEHRMFPDWAMRRVERSQLKTTRLAPLHALLDIISDNQRQNVDLSRVLERSIWRELNAAH
ncbi:MAG TPA: blue light sensor protein [Myxococcales bacterium]|nr:blue light sensor protein [Myxococcales bacterium]